MPRKQNIEAETGFDVPDESAVPAAAVESPAPAAAVELGNLEEEIDEPVAAAPQIPQQAEKPEEFPSDLRKSFAIYYEIDAQPTRNPREERAKAAAMAKIKAHIAALQNGSPVVSITANEYQAAGHANNSRLLFERLETKARTDLDVRELLAKYNALKEQLETITGGE